jgi:hypothetical protein
MKRALVAIASMAIMATAVGVEAANAWPSGVAGG